MGTATAPHSSDDDGVHYVRVTDSDHRGNVEFQFSIGDPSLYLEMTLPKPAFDEFCREHHVRVLSKQEGAKVDADERRWRFGDDEQE
jgi:phenol hydroxylase P0 protein